MPKCKALVGGWKWGDSEVIAVGQIIDAPSEEWIDNRINDIGAKHPKGLVERVAEAPVKAPTKPKKGEE